jgi:hypothetical protein
MALYFIHGAFISRQRAFVQVFLSAGKRYIIVLSLIIALSLNLSKCKQVLILFILLSMEQCPIFYFKICISYYFNFLMCSA